MLVLGCRPARVRLEHLADDARQVEYRQVHGRIYEPGLVQLAHIDVRVPELEVIDARRRREERGREVDVGDEIDEYECAQDNCQPRRAA